MAATGSQTPGAPIPREEPAVREDPRAAPWAGSYNCRCLLVVDEDYRPRVEVVLDLGDLRGEWDFSHSIGFRGGPMGLRW